LRFCDLVWTKSNKEIDFTHRREDAEDHKVSPGKVQQL
jgi:hypothetical protein